MKFLERIKVKFAISRIIKMEKLFDDLRFSFEKSKEEFYKNKNLQKKLKSLTNYYESGKWLKDYQLDEQNKLPKNLKRGILSQDGIYDFLSEVENREV